MKNPMQALGPFWILLLTLTIFPCGTPAPAPDLCPEGAKILQPSDGETILIGTMYTIIVSVPDKVLELKINGSTVVNLVAEGPPHTWEYQYPWSPPAPGTYLIEARASGPLCLEASPWDQVEVTVLGFATEACLATSNANLYCRRGTDTTYEAIDTILPGQTIPVTGQSPDGKYLYLIGPNSNLPCAVPNNPEYFQLSGACQDLPIFTPGPTSVPPPTEKAHPKPAQCNDGKDNDGDRLIDMRDPQCRNPDDNSEATP